MKIYRRLVKNKTFWGLVKMGNRGWRIGFRIGFIEIGTSTSGLWLPK